MAKHWIQNAIKHPGALHKEMGVPQGKPIPAGKLHAAAEKGGVEGKRARLAETLKGMHHGGSHSDGHQAHHSSHDAEALEQAGHPNPAQGHFHKGA